MAAQLFAEDLGLLRQGYLAVFLSRLYYFVHRLETFLHLFHQAALSLKTQTFILLQLVN